MHAVTGSAGMTRAPRRLLIALIMSLGVALSLIATPAQAVEPQYRGLFGAQNPTYDGVDRQATAILGLVAVGAKVPQISINWLLRQQCADGSFSAFREDTSVPCGAPDLVNYTGPNTNSTALAAMALSALATSDTKVKQPARKAAAKAVGWLVSQQGNDGGWEWLAGLGSDSTSTAMTMAALNQPKSQSHRRGATFLRNAMPVGLGCAVAFMPGSPIGDPLSTSWTFIASQGPLPYRQHRGSRSVTQCAEAQTVIRASGSWLASALTDGSGQIPSAFEPGQTDWNVTALATLGMTQRHGSTQAMRLGLAALKANVDAYVVADEVDRAAPLGVLLMIAHATKSDPRKFGGVDLTRRLLLTVQR
jgi:hypothetical protein